MKRSLIYVTCGDPSGIGPEIILANFQKHPDLFEGVVVLAPGGTFEDWGGTLSLNYLIGSDLIRPLALKRGKLNVLKMGSGEFSPKKGGFQPTEESAKLVWEQFKMIQKLFQLGKLQGLVTGPIHKETLVNLGFEFKGHTDFLGSFSGGPTRMVMSHEKTHILMHTLHTPLQSIFKEITPDSLKISFHLLKKYLIQLGYGPHPLIALLGLNPHAGENGCIGSEELTIFKPFLTQLAKEGERCDGPFPADSFFHQTWKKFHGILSLYHDQGLIPIKMVAGFKGVNVTLGLPFVRTSVGHGTAHDICFKQKSDPDSFGNALRLCRLLMAKG